MRLLRRCAREVWSLFVDDGVFALLVVGWIAVACLVLGRVSAEWSGVALFLGLAGILAAGMR